jgi:hypothetical protein
MAKNSHYDFSKWPTKAAGARPTVEQVNVAHAFGKPGKQSLALAMALRTAGTTADQVLAAVEAVFNVPGGRPQNNHRKRVIKAGWFARLPAVAGDSNHTVYAIKLTPKGQAYVDSGATMAAAAEPAKPAKAKRAKRAKAAKPAVQAEPVMTPEAEAASMAAEAALHDPEATS